VALLSFAVVAGTLSGLLEVAFMAIQKASGHMIMERSRDVVWMAPLVMVVLTVGAGCTGYAAGRLWRPQRALRLALFASCVTATLNLLLFLPRIHKVADLVLAVGVAAQMVRYAESHLPVVFRVARRGAGLLVLVVLVLAVGTRLPSQIRQRRAVARLPVAAADAANVVFITLDTVRAANLSLYGYSRRTTPRLEKRATHGVVFEQALSTAPWTLPSHASMFTGHWDHDLSVGYGTALDATFPTLAEYLSSHGYSTAGFVANKKFCGRATGLNRGFLHYEDYPVSLAQLLANSTLARAVLNNFRLRTALRTDAMLARQSADDLNASVLRWLKRGHRRPFFLFINYFDAHEPYLPPAPFKTKFGPGRGRGSFSPLDHLLHDPGWRGKRLGDEAVREEVAAYDGSLAYLDDRVDALLEAVSNRDPMRPTLVVITADHGEEFGEHRVFAHGNSLYRTSVRVPLLILFDRSIPAGARVTEPVSLRDLPATIVDLLGLEQGSPFPGRSLARYFDSARIDQSARQPILSELQTAGGLPDWYPVSKGDMKAIVYDGMRYIRGGAGIEELYDYAGDPWERRDLSDSPAFRQYLTKFRALAGKRVEATTR